MPHHSLTRCRCLRILSSVHSSYPSGRSRARESHVARPASLPPPPPCTPLFEINLRRLPCLFPPLRHGLHCHSHAKLVALLCLELALFRAMLDADLESGGDLLDSERGGCYAGQREERERCC